MFLASTEPRLVICGSFGLLHLFIGDVNYKLGQIVADVDANGYPPVQVYRQSISDFADSVVAMLDVEGAGVGVLRCRSVRVMEHSEMAKEFLPRAKRTEMGRVYRERPARREIAPQGT